ncbi:MAG: hypothetical protein OXQ90_10570 [Gammaproteobacteria bacterium]|nr:hypothetical protein [Gammaproteobacteria bacterium]
MRPGTSAAALLSLALSAPTAVHAEYLAHAVGKSSRVPLPESTDGIDAHYLMDLHWGYRGGRSIVTVTPVADARDALPSRAAGSRAAADAEADIPLEAIHAIVSEALRRTGRFEVHGSSTDAARPGVPSKGDSLQVSVSAYESRVVTRITNPRARRTQGSQVETGRIALSMRLVGAAGEVKIVDYFDALVEKPRTGLSGAGTADALLANILRTSIGQAALAAANKGAYEIVKAVGPLPVSGLVVKAEEERVWVNLGGGVVSVGDELEVTAKGEALVDPETGLDLGGVETSLATVRVVQVEERFSVAELLSAAGTPARGDHVRSTTGAAGFEFAPDWDPPGKEAF